MSLTGILFRLIAVILVRQAATRVVSGISRISPRDTFEVSRYGYLGDSFAAGPGAGRQYGDVTSCRRSQDAWGPLVAEDTRLRGPKPIERFDFIACSGARTWHIHGKTPGQAGNGQPAEPQASLLKNTQPELVTLSIGGNDIGFADLLDRVSFSNGFMSTLVLSSRSVYISSPH